MAETKPSAQAEGPFDFMDLFDTADKSLDQVKKYLEAQKEELQRLREQGNLEDLAANIKRIATEGFQEDLKENGKVTEADQAPYLAEFNTLWEEMQMSQKAEAILNSPEFSAMDEFARRAENLPKLKELIETAKPQAKWQMMLSGILASFPALQQYFGDDISKLLANLGVIPKQEEEKEEGEESEETAQDDKKEEDGEKQVETAETPNDGPLDGPEGVPESFKPGKTLICGDSHYEPFSADQYKSLREKLNATEMLAKGSMQSGWGSSELEKKSNDFFKDFEYAVIGFGSNDMGSADDAPKIWSRLRHMISILREKNPKIKIIMAKVPPAKGNPYGEWGSNFEGVEKKREELNGFIEEAKQRGDIQGVMDLAAKKKDGGLANDNDPSEMDPSLRRPGDKVHARAEIIAAAIRRAQYHAREVEVKS